MIIILSKSSGHVGEDATIHTLHFDWEDNVIGIDSTLYTLCPVGCYVNRLPYVNNFQCRL